jgi:hypothetical protein
MAEIEKTMPPAYDIKAPFDIKTLNPAGRDIPEISGAQEEAIRANEALMKALQERYAKPNWFKVAAGFAKPQLGGFLASLGSAAEAMGETVEAERAIAPTIARMRAEVAAGRAGLAQRTEQERAIREYDSQGKKDVNELRRILSLDPDSPIAKSIKERIPLEQERRAEAGFGVELQEALQKNPSLIITDPTYKGIAIPEDKQKEYIDQVNNGRPKGISPASWNAMTFPQRQEAIAKAGYDQLQQGMKEGQVSAMNAERSHDVLDELVSLRKLATDEKLKPVFALFSDGDLFSQLRAFLEQNPGRINDAVQGLVAATMNKLANVDPATRAKFDKLVKGIAEVEVRLRGTVNNPTDAASTLSSQRSPNLLNSQAGFVGIIDQLGLNAYRDIEMHHLRRQKGLTDADLMDTGELRKFRNQTRSLREQLASQNALETTPSWFFPEEGRTPFPAAPVTPAPVPSAKAETASPTGGGSMLERLRQERQERERRRPKP